VVSFNLQGLLFLSGSSASAHSAQPLIPGPPGSGGQVTNAQGETWGWGTIGTNWGEAAASRWHLRW
jgi:hypothetical protein